MTNITNIGTKFNGRDLSVSAQIGSMRWNLGFIGLANGNLYFAQNDTKTGGEEARIVVGEHMEIRRGSLIQQIENGRAQYA